MALTRAPLRSLWHARAAALLTTRLAPDARPDAVIVDPEPDDPGRLEALVRAARTLVLSAVLLRVGAPPSPAVADALGVALPAGLDGLLLSGCADARDVQHCGVKLAVAEAAHGLPAGLLGVIAAPGPGGFLQLGGFAGAGSRLRGLAQEGAVTGEARDGAVLGTLLRLAARSAGVPAYDGVCEDRASAAGRAGFDGRITRDPAAIAGLNALFSGGA